MTAARMTPTPGDGRDTRVRRPSAVLALTIAMLAAAALTGAVAPAAVQAATIPPSNTIPFAAIRNNDSDLGSHTLTFRREGEDLIVEKSIRFRVDVAFITAYRYEHDNREVWRGGRLISLDTTTNDDGKKHWVRGRATDAGFAVESSRGSFVYAADVIPTSYWNIATIGATQLLDTQRGLLMDVRIDPKGVEPIQAGGQVIDARHFRINLLTNQPGATSAIDIWYDDNDAWVKLAFDAKGQYIAYALRPEGLVPPGTVAPANGQAASLPAPTTETPAAETPATETSAPETPAAAAPAVSAPATPTPRTRRWTAPPAVPCASCWVTSRPAACPCSATWTGRPTPS
ncbi:MAG: hypothetical protein RLY86_1964 [Pseudomonadota bacterium]|jgi:hypothetical protein